MLEIGENKAGNTATQVACGRAGAVKAKTLLMHLGRSSDAKTARKRRKSKKSDGQTDGTTDGRTDGQSGVQSRVHATKKGLAKCECTPFIFV